LFTRGLLQVLHITSAAEDSTIFSNFDPQSRHWYSKSGILVLLPGVKAVHAENLPATARTLVSSLHSWNIAELNDLFNETLGGLKISDEQLNRTRVLFGFA
jgi:hypothetical protein